MGPAAVLSAWPGGRRFCSFAHVRKGLRLVVWTRWRRRASAGIAILQESSFLPLFCPLGTAENALHRVPVSWRAMWGIPDPPGFFA